MAAPLPSGVSIQALPTAPVVDPRMFAGDTQGALAAAQAGLLLGNELADIGRKRGERELRMAQIKAEQAKAAYDLQVLDHAEQNLPTFVAAKVQQALAETKSAEVQRMLSEARLGVGAPESQARLEASQNANALAGSEAAAAAQLPALQAQTQAAQAKNALAGATADLGFSQKSTPVKTQLLASAQALGGMGIPEGDLSSIPGGVPPAFRKQVEVEELDPKTGNTMQRIDVIDTRNGAVLFKGEPRVTKLGVDEKSVTQATKEAVGIVQTLDLAAQLEAQLDPYIAADKGGLGQAIASNVANKAPTGPVSVISKAMGAKLQSPETIKLVGAISNLKNTIANELFGSALSKEESTNLQGMLPTAEDLADPARAKEKLQTTKQFLETKLRTYRERGVLEKAGLNVDGRGSPFTAGGAAGKSVTVQDLAKMDAPVGSEQTIGANIYRVIQTPGGKAWARVK